MKVVIIFLLFLEVAQSKEKTLQINAHVKRITLAKNQTYQLELNERAAFYYAPEVFLPCLQKSIDENKKALLEVAAHTLIVKSCSVN
jgi:hypothetical protein